MKKLAALTHLEMPVFVVKMKQNRLKGGRRSHSRYAHLYPEIVKLRAKRMTWDEITQHISNKTGEAVPRQSLYDMYRNRQSGAVLIESSQLNPAKAKPIASTSKKIYTPPPPTMPRADVPLSRQHATSVTDEDELLGLPPEEKPKAFKVFVPPQSPPS